MDKSSLTSFQVLLLALELYHERSGFHVNTSIHVTYLLSALYLLLVKICHPYLNHGATEFVIFLSFGLFFSLHERCTCIIYDGNYHYLPTL